MALGLILFFFMLIGLASAPKESIPSDAVLHLKLDQQVPELTNNVEQSPYTFESAEVIGLNDYTRLLRKAAGDSKIKGLVIQTENTYLAPAMALRFAELIEEFKASGKFVEAYGKYFTQSGYAIASVADTVHLNPNGLIDLRGYGMVIPYFKEFSEKSGIDFDVYFAGKYKSAIEPFYLSEVSDANRLQTQEYLGAFQDAMVNHIAEVRDLGVSTVDEIFVEGLSQNADDAISLDLVDELIYWDDFEEKLKSKYDLSKIRLQSIEKYYQASPALPSTGQDRIAVVYAEGEIAHSGKLKGTVNMEVYEDILDRIKSNKRVKSVVLRVNSPGGSSLTSDLFWKKIQEIQEAGKVVVASFGNYAASGGYYIACGADYIVSEPLCLTGSVGVFSMIPDMSQFFEEKLGIHWDTIGTGKHTFMYSTYVDRSDQDNQKIMSDTERTYTRFKSKISEGRNLSMEEVEDIAQGRVWTGIDGSGNGLVDTLGNLDDAIQIAANLSDIEDYKLLEYPRIKKTFYEELIGEIMRSGMAMQTNVQTPSRLTQEVNKLLSFIEESSHGPQARMPFLVPSF